MILAFILVSFVIAGQMLSAYVALFATQRQQAHWLGFDVAIMRVPEMQILLRQQGLASLSLALVMALVLIFVGTKVPLVLLFLMGYVVVIGVSHGLSLNRKFLLVESLPALLAFVSLLFI